jgi:hypothetical protein
MQVGSMPHRNGCTPPRVVYGVSTGSLFRSRARLGGCTVAISIARWRSAVRLRLRGFGGHLSIGTRRLRHVARALLEGTIQSAGTRVEGVW